MVERDHLGADRPIYDGADLLGHFHEIAARLGNQRGVGGNTVEQAGGGQFADVIDLGGVDEEFHALSLFGQVPRTGLMRPLALPRAQSQTRYSDHSRKIRDRLPE